jgi:RHS repeat-associated protein
MSPDLARRHLVRRLINLAFLGGLVVTTATAAPVASLAAPAPPALPDRALPIDAASAAQHAPVLVADSAGNLYAVWQDFRDQDASRVRFAYRPAGGAWQPSERIDRDNSVQWRPTLAVDGSGNTYAAWLDERSDQDKVYFAFRPAGGTWGDSEALTRSVPRQEDQQRPALAVNRRGDAVLIWAQGSNQTKKHAVHAAIRPAGGAWAAAERLAEFGGELWNFDADAAIDDWGRAHALWKASPEDAVMHATRTPGGAWTPPHNLRTSSSGKVTYPALALDSAGNAHAVWGDARNGDADIYAAYRPAGGPWSTNMRVNDDGTDKTQIRPDLAVDGAGNAVATWTDERKGHGDMYGSVRSRGGGWGANVLILHWAPAATASSAGDVRRTPPPGPLQESQSPFYQSCGASGGSLYCAFAAPSTPSGDPYQVYFEDGASPGAGGDCTGGGTAMTLAVDRAAAVSAVQVGVLSAQPDDRCAAGNGAEPPIENADDGAQDWPPGDRWDVHMVEEGGHLFYVVTGADGNVGIFGLDNRADAVAFANGHAQPPGDPGAGNPPPPAQPPVPPPAQPPLPPAGPTVEPGSWTVEYADDPSPPLTPAMHASFQAAWLVGVAELRPLTPAEQRELAQHFSQMDPGSDSYNLLRDQYQGYEQHWHQVAVQAAQAARPTDTAATTGQPTPPPTGKVDRLTEYYREQYGTSGLSGILGIGSRPPTEPVLPHSGEFVYEQTPLRIPGRGIDYRLRLTYHSQLVHDGRAGWGWEHDYDRRLVDAGGGSLARWDGGGRSLPLSFDGVRFTPPGGLYTAVVSTTRGISLTAPGGTVEGFFPLDNSPLAGRLRTIRDRNGNALHFDYDAQARLQTVIDTLGRPITYAYDATGRVASVTDFTGRTVTLTHDIRGDLVEITTAAVTGTPNGNDFPAGKTTRFAYTGGFQDQRLNHNLVAVVSPNEVADGSLTARETNEYGTSGLEFDRVVRQSWGGGRSNASGVPAGGTVTLAYSTAIEATAPTGTFSKTTITDRGGNVIELWHDGAGHRLRSRRTVAGQPTVFEYTYNTDGLVTSVTYPAGSRFEARYDEASADPLARRNLLEWRQVPDAARGCDGIGGGPCPALVTTFTYEPVFQRVHATTDPRGATTTRSYDARGNLTRVTLPGVTVGSGAPQTAELAWTYNAWGQALTFTDAEGHVTRNAYVASGPGTGHLQRTTLDSGGQDVATTYAYDDAGHVVAVTDARGVRTEYAVNALGQVVKEIRASAEGLDYERAYWYDANDNLVRVDVENVLPVMDANHHPTGAHARDAANPWLTTTYVRDLLDNLVRTSVEVDPSWEAVTTYQYDSLEQLVSVTSPAGRRQETDYDELGRVVRVTAGAGTADASATTYTYDANGNLVRVTDPLGQPTDIVYDGFDRQAAVVDALGNVRTWRHDGNGNVVEARLGDGQEGRNPGRTVDAAGLVVLGNEHFAYDERNRLILAEKAFFTADVGTGTTTPLTGDGDGDGWVETAYAYDRSGALIGVADDQGHTTEYAYDGVGRLARRTDALRNTVTYDYDGAGNLARMVETEHQADGLTPDATFTTRYTHDAEGRLVSVTDNLDRTTRAAYDSRGNLVFRSDADGAPVGTTNAHGNTALLAYDGLGHLLSATYHLRAGGTGAGTVDGELVTTYAYDLDGTLVEHTDLKGSTTTYARDAVGRVVEVTCMDLTATTFRYDRAGNLAARTDANGTVVASTYDALRRPVRTEVTRGPGVGGTTLQTFTWDGLSRLTAATDDNDPADPGDDSRLGYAYDSLSHIVRDTQGTYALDRSVDGEGNIVAVTYADGQGLTIAHDALNRVREVRDDSGPIARYDYLGPWRVWRRAIGSGAAATYAYDGARRLTALEYRVTGDTGPIAAFQYTYDRAGRRATETVQPGGRKATYKYDSVGQLTFVAAPPSYYTFDYDPAGNRTLATRNEQVDEYYADTMSAYEMIGGMPQTYDANGNLRRAMRIRRAAPEAGQARIYLPFAIRPRGPATLAASRAPIEARRIAATEAVTETATDLRYDFRDRVIGVTRTLTVTTEGGARVTTAVFGFAYDARDRQVLARSPEGVRHLAHAGGQVAEVRDDAGALLVRYAVLLSMDRAGARNYILTDAGSTVRVLTGATGEIVARVDYEPFGTAVVADGGHGTAVATSPLFQGRHLAAGGAFYMFGARAYDPDTGRYLQRARAALGPTYTFAGNDPLTIEEP